MFKLVHKAYPGSHTWRVYLDKTMTNYVGSIWHTRVPTEGTPEWEMYVANTDNSIIMPIQFADENAVVTFLAVLHDVWNYGLFKNETKKVMM